MTKETTIKNIENHTKDALYYMAQAAKAMQQGESPVLWLCNAVKAGADLKADYTKADDIDIYDSLDFKQIYADALERASADVKNDD